MIICENESVWHGIYSDVSRYPKENWLYILVGGPLGWGYDSTVGADNQYTSPVNIDLSRSTGPDMRAPIVIASSPDGEQ